MEPTWPQSWVPFLSLHFGLMAALPSPNVIAIHSFWTTSKYSSTELYTPPESWIVKSKTNCEEQLFYCSSCSGDTNSRFVRNMDYGGLAGQNFRFDGTFVLWYKNQTFNPDLGIFHNWTWKSQYSNVLIFKYRVFVSPLDHCSWEKVVVNWPGMNRIEAKSCWKTKTRTEV